MTEAQWRSIINTIRQEECILMLGPGTSCAKIKGKEKPLSQILALEMVKELEDNGVPYEESLSEKLNYIAQRYSTIDGVIETDPAFLAKDFFQRYAQACPLHHDLAALPFKLIINANPDDLIVRAYRAAGKGYVFGYYNFRSKGKLGLAEPEQDETIIYNIFGSIGQDYKSVVITESDRIRFAQNVIKGNPPLPTKINYQFEDPKNYLFLGFDYEEWHLRLLLDTLKIGKDDKRLLYAPQMPAFPLTKPTEQFYQDEFHFLFVSDHIGAFISELKTRYDTIADEEGEPKPPPIALKVVILAAAEDLDYQDDLLKHLYFLENRGYVTFWHEGLLTAGTERSKETFRELDAADIILPLVSADLLAGQLMQDFIQWRTGQHLLDCEVVPVIARDCVWTESILGKLPTVLPANKKHQAIQNWNNPDDAYKNIAESFKRIVYERVKAKNRQPA